MLFVILPGGETAARDKAGQSESHPAASASRSGECVCGGGGVLMHYGVVSGDIGGLVNALWSGEWGHRGACKCIMSGFIAMLMNSFIHVVLVWAGKL